MRSAPGPGPTAQYLGPRQGRIYFSFMSLSGGGQVSLLCDIIQGLGCSSENSQSKLSPNIHVPSCGTRKGENVGTEHLLLGALLCWGLRNTVSPVCKGGWDAQSPAGQPAAPSKLRRVCVLSLKQAVGGYWGGSATTLT